jgi:hypothetical protein
MTQAGAKAACFDANGGIDLRVVVRPAAVYLHSDERFLDLIRLARKGCFHNERQKLCLPRRGCELWTAENPRQM